MSDETPGSFLPSVVLHEHLMRTPDPAANADALHPGRFDPPREWTPDLLPKTDYETALPADLGLMEFNDFHDIPDDSLDRAIRRVVAVEGPVHFDVLADRLLEATGVGRLGARIRARIESRLETLTGPAPADGLALERQGDFVARPLQFLKPRYRDWRTAPEKTRQLDHVSDPELMLAVLRVVLDEGIRDRERAMNDGLHAIGFIRLTEKARMRLQKPLEQLKAQGWLN